jgi:hypothetical protein
MYPHSLLWHYLWIAPHVLQVVIAVVMIRRKLYREFPIFLTYTITDVVQSTVLFVMDHSPSISGRQYWEAYFCCTVVCIALRFAVIREIFFHVFRPYPGLKDMSWVIFQGSALVLLLAGVAMVVYAPGNGANPLLSGVHVLDQTVGLMQCGLLALLILFSSYFRLSWRSQVFGIAAGLGIFASVDLATAAMRVWIGAAAANYVFDFVTMATYHCCVLIWLGYLLLPESSRRVVKELPENDLEQWNTELQRLLLK